MTWLSKSNKVLVKNFPEKQVKKYLRQWIKLFKKPSDSIIIHAGNNDLTNIIINFTSNKNCFI